MCNARFVPNVGLRHFQSLIHALGRFPTEDLGYALVLRAHHNHLAGVRAPVLSPIPHVERMDAVVGVPGAIHADIVGIMREVSLVLCLKHH